MMVLALCTAVSAQETQKKEVRKFNPEMRAKHVADALLLDDAAQAKFVPLYQEYMKALAECRTPRTRRAPEAKVTEKELDEQMKLRFESEQKRLDVQKNYYDKFKKIMTVRQVQKLYAMNRPNQAQQGRKPGQPVMHRGANKMKKADRPQGGAQK